MSLQDRIVYNEEGKMFIPGGKNAGIFEGDNNGTTSFNGRLAIKNTKLGGEAVYATIDIPDGFVDSTGSE